MVKVEGAPAAGVFVAGRTAQPRSLTPADGLSSPVIPAVGEVVSTEQWHLLDQVERSTGRTLIGRGPLDPTGDPVWQRYLGGELSFTDYWAEYALANGYDDWRSLSDHARKLTRFVVQDSSEELEVGYEVRPLPGRALLQRPQRSDRG